jgi:hypothetical protein
MVRLSLSAISKVAVAAGATDESRLLERRSGDTRELLRK